MNLIKSNPKISLLFFAFLVLSLQSYGQYCLTNLYTNPCTGNFISNVTITGTTLNNTTICTGISGTSSNVYAPTPITRTGIMQQGVTYGFSVTTTDASVISVWIDYNHNNTFDVNEWYQITLVSVPNVPSVLPITIPFNALTGATAMRIRIRDDGLANGATEPCVNFLSGEMEQYTITINAAPVCTVPPNAGTTICTMDTVCPTSDFTLSLQNADIAQGLSQQWQSSPNGTTWTNIGGATNTTLKTTQYLTTYYRCQVTCSGSTVTSTPFLVTMLVPNYYNFNGGTIYNQNFDVWRDACDNNDIPYDPGSTNWINTPINGNESWRKHNEGFTTGQWTFPNGGFTLVPHLGAGAAQFHTFSGSGLPGALDLYLDCSNFTTITIDFWYFKNQSGFDKFEVSVSTNGGFTFGPPVLTILNSVAGGFGPVWVEKLITNVAVGNANQVIVRFKDFGDIFGTNDTGMDDLRIDGILGISSEADDISNIAVLPNPSNGNVEIRCSNKNFTNTKVNLIDVTGRIVSSTNFHNDNSFWSQTLDWSNQAKGVYFVQFISESKVLTQKIIIE